MPVHDIPGREIAERLAFIQQHPDDPGLSPAEIAAAHHISLRLLHNLFQEQGETVWRGGSGHGAGGVRIVTLDSLVPGKWYSHLGTGQLRWAAAVLTSEQPSILAFHHPPVDLGVEIQQRVGLGDRGKRH